MRITPSYILDKWATEKKDQLFIWLSDLSITSKKCEKKKLIATLFMDIKKIFDIVSKRQLFNQIIELEIDSNLLT